MDVPSFCADVQPFTLEGQVAESYSVKRRRHELKVLQRMTEERKRKGGPGGTREKDTDGRETEASCKSISVLL